jgi:DNA-binding transcriptional ArsR family regulator
MLTGFRRLPKNFNKRLKYLLYYSILLGSPWKAISDDHRRKILLMLKKRDMNPTDIAKHFDFTLPGISAHLRILKDADLVLERKKGQRVFYSLNKKCPSDVKRFFKIMWPYRSK